MNVLGALDQRTYPGAGDIDDCWVVATMWAFRYQTHMATEALPSIPVFRDAADNPDKPGPTGGRNSQIALALNRLYPGQPYSRYESTNWTSFMAQLRAGAAASVVTLSSLLPSTMQFNFHGLHRCAVIWLDGTLVLMNPLQRDGAKLLAITEAQLRRAITGATPSGTVLAIMFPAQNRGSYSIRPYSSGVPRPYRRYKRNAQGKWVSQLRGTRGLSGTAMPPDPFTINGHSGRYTLVTSGVNAGWWIEITTGRTYTP